MTHPFLFWGGFHLLIATLLYIDLKCFQRGAMNIKKASWLSVFWIATALCFNLFLYFSHGRLPAVQFFTGYLVEKSLSVDNLLVFLMIFNSFRLSPEEQRKVLFYGILGALFFRVTLILGGIALIREFHWMVYLLGLFLIATGIRFLVRKEAKGFDPKERGLVGFLKKRLPMTEKGKGAFFVYEEGKLKFTALFLVLVVIECTDIIFALDSIPAVFAITQDPFIVYTSNLFAILGLRALYFAIAGSMGNWRHLRYGLAAILLFVGIKMVFSGLFSIPLLISLAVILIILLFTAIYSYSSAR
jgi:tellurite resistance protein TerC